MTLCCKYQYCRPNIDIICADIQDICHNNVLPYLWWQDCCSGGEVKSACIISTRGRCKSFQVGQEIDAQVTKPPNAQYGDPDFSNSCTSPHLEYPLGIPNMPFIREYFLFGFYAPYTKKRNSIVKYLERVFWSYDVKHISHSSCDPYWVVMFINVWEYWNDKYMKCLWLKKVWASTVIKRAVLYHHDQFQLWFGEDNFFIQVIVVMPAQKCLESILLWKCCFLGSQKAMIKGRKELCIGVQPGRIIGSWTRLGWVKIHCNVSQKAAPK